MSEPRTSISSYPVVLPADPTTDPQAATKHYVDGAAEQRVSIDGDTMLGPLILSGAPSANNEAVTKAYVDALGRPVAAEVPLTPTGDVASDNVQEGIAELASEKVAKAGDSMTGPLLLDSSNPVANLAATPKSYVDKMGSQEFTVSMGDLSWNGAVSMYEVAINHELDRRPRVTLYDSSGVEFCADVVYNTIGVNGLVIRLKILADFKALLT